MPDPIANLAAELIRAGYQVPVALLSACLRRADITLSQGQRPAVAAHLVEVERLARDGLAGSV